MTDIYTLYLLMNLKNDWFFMCICILRFPWTLNNKCIAIFEHRTHVHITLFSICNKHSAVRNEEKKTNLRLINPCQYITSNLYPSQIQCIQKIENYCITIIIILDFQSKSLSMNTSKNWLKSQCEKKFTVIYVT